MPNPGKIEYGPGGRRAQWNGQSWIELPPVPQAVRDKNQKKLDEQTLESAREGVMAASTNRGTADEIARLLQKQPTGKFYDINFPFYGKVRNSNLQSIERLGQSGVFPDLSKLKGPLSDKDLAFLRSQQVSVANYGDENQRIVNLMRWASNRAVKYEEAIQAWNKVLGSPNVPNRKGQSFQSWWLEYADKNIPRPDIFQGTKNAEPQGKIIARRSAR